MLSSRRRLMYLCTVAMSPVFIPAYVLYSFKIRILSLIPLNSGFRHQGLRKRPLSEYAFKIGECRLRRCYRYRRGGHRKGNLFYSNV
jgi:hypothetical protein